MNDLKQTCLQHIKDAFAKNGNVYLFGLCVTKLRDLTTKPSTAFFQRVQLKLMGKLEYQKTRKISAGSRRPRNPKN